MKMRRTTAVMLGISAGYAALLLGLSALTTLDGSDLAVMTACFGASLAAMAPALEEERKRGACCRRGAEAGVRGAS